VSFLKNAWYVAAWGREVPTEKLLPRILLGEPVVFFRDEKGAVAGIEDRCPHRFAPLHEGTLEGGQVRCRYHGLEFNGAGACVRNPHGNGAIPSAARVKSYRVVEKDLIVWVWMSDESAADESLIPDFSFLTSVPDTARNTGYLPTAANYQLLADNIMDLSHVDYLHPTTLGGGAMTRSRPEVTESGTQVRIKWTVKDDVVPPSFAHHMPDPNAKADQTTQVVWYPPGYMNLSTSVEVADGQDICTNNLHLMTPETEERTHYFFANTRNFVQEDGEFNRMLDTILINVFSEEDKPMVEAQQRNMGTSDLFSLRPVLLACDGGAVRARRTLETLIANEQAMRAQP